MTDTEKQELKQAVLRDIRSIVPTLLPGGKFRGNKWVCDNLNGGEGRSFNIELDGEKAGVWFDFATEEAGDIFDLISYTQGVDFAGALAWAQDFTGQRYSATTESEVKVEPVKHTGYPERPEICYTYLNEVGEPVLCVERVEQGGKKRFVQWSKNNGLWYKTSAYCPKPYPMWSIYGAEPEDTIVIHEGEKSAEFAQMEGLEGYHTCTIGGATNARRSDFRPLAGRSVVYICPDNDEPGQKYAHDVTECLKDVGVKQVKVINLEPLPHKGDVVDWFEQGKTVEDWSLAVANASTVYTQPVPQPEPVVEPVAESTEKDFRYVPEQLLDIPGFINDVVDYTMSVSPYPNRVHAFGAALCLQALLASNRVFGDMGTRPNIYVNCLGASASGKNKPRIVNRNILDDIGGASHVWDNMASMEGLEDLLETHPNVLFQPDEFDSFLATSATGDTRFRRITTFLMSAFTSADGNITRRPKANEPGVVRIIRNPHLSLLATSTPTRYFESLDSQSMADGFVGRMITLCSKPTLRKLSDEEKDYSRPLPESITDIASHWWNMNRPEAQQGADKVRYVFPEAVYVPLNKSAKDARREAEQYFVDRYNRFIEDENKSSIYGRGLEHLNKWALLMACSENPYELMVKPEHIEAAFKFVRYQIKTVLNANDNYVYKNADDKHNKRVRQIIQGKGGQCKKGDILRATGYSKKKLDDALATLQESGDIELEKIMTGERGRPSWVVKLVA